MVNIELGPGDPAPVEIINPNALESVLITGDHAGNAVPASMNGLGLSKDDMTRHIAWDIGAAGVVRALARSMSATAVLSVYSRLVIDPNRPLGDPACAPAVSDGTEVPANQNITDDIINARARAFYWPYHRAVDEEIGRIQRAGIVPSVVAIHTFTPAMNNTGAQARPWHAGILYSQDTRLPHALMDALRAEDGLVVGDNEPYSGVTHGYTLKIHGIAHGLPHVELEIRQDLVADAAGQEKWANLLARLLPPLLARPEMKKVVHI